MNEDNGYNLVKKNISNTKSTTQEFKFKVGDVVKVTDIMQQYVTYENWFSEQGIPIPPLWRFGKFIEDSCDNYVIQNKGFFSAEDKDIVYHITNGKNSYLIGEKGLTSVEDNTNIIPETDEDFRGRLRAYHEKWGITYDKEKFEIISGQQLDDHASFLGMRRQGKDTSKVEQECRDHIINSSKEDGDDWSFTPSIWSATGKDLDKLASILGVESRTDKVTQINLNNINGENNMTTQLRTVNITLVDNNTNLKGKDKVVFQKLNYLTEYSDEDTKVNIIATGKVAKAVTEHNEEVRAKTVDDTILRSTGRDVPLKPIELLSDSQLSWNIVTVA